eukprot:1256693-Amorphochlora_amoeboformis.AAC.2
MVSVTRLPPSMAKEAMGFASIAKAAQEASPLCYTSSTRGSYSRHVRGLKGGYSSVAGESAPDKSGEAVQVWRAEKRRLSDKKKDKG